MNLYVKGNIMQRREGCWKLNEMKDKTGEHICCKFRKLWKNIHKTGKYPQIFSLKGLLTILFYFLFVLLNFLFYSRV